MYIAAPKCQTLSESVISGTPYLGMISFSKIFTMVPESSFWGGKASTHPNIYSTITNKCLYANDDGMSA